MRLTGALDGKSVFILPQHCMAVYEDTTGYTAVVLIGESFLVRESVNEVVAALLKTQTLFEVKG